MSNFSFDGKRNSFCSYMDYTSHWGQNRELGITDVKGRAGGVLTSIENKVREIEVSLLVDSEGTNYTLEEIADKVVEWFTTDEPKPLIFDREPNKIYYAMLNGPIEKDYFVRFGKATATFVCIDPYKYSTSQYENTAISDELAVNNRGTADTPVFIQARALKDSTSFMIAKGKDGVPVDYFMVGKSEDANKVNKDEEPFLFNDEFHTGIGNWAYVAANTTFGNLLDGGDANGGRFGVSELKESIYPNNFGTTLTTNWHGAAIYKSLGKSLGDFKIKFKLLIRQYAGTGTGKGFAYIVDENNRKLFSIGYVNTSTSRNYGKIVAYAYNEHGEAQRIYTRETPFKYLKIENMHIFMTLQRKGNKIYIETYKYDYGKDKGRRKPLDKDSKTFTDSGNFYQRNARIAQMYVGKSSKYEKYMYVNILGFSIQELLPKQSDVTPILIRQGDLISIDTQLKLVTINDEVALKHKDFGSNYFNLDKGLSELIIEPEGTFDTVATWRNRWL